MSNLLTELLLPIDWIRLKTSPLYYGLGPRGHGEPVVLIPGAMAADCTMLEMRLWLNRMGYRAYASGIGSVIDCPDIMVKKLNQTIGKARNETGQKVTLIGHSLGGLIARVAALERPEWVERVITLGAPFRRPTAHPLVMNFIGLVHGRELERHIGREEACVRPFTRLLGKSIYPVESAAIYTKSDPIVNWEDCVMERVAYNYEVSGTHSGLIINRQVYQIVASLLAQPPKEGNEGVQ